MSLLPNSDQQRIGLILTGGGARVIKFDRIQHNIDIGLLDALSITASAYSSGESVSFYRPLKIGKTGRAHTVLGSGPSWDWAH